MAELHRRIAAALDGYDWEAIFVDDGSTDATFARLRELHDADPRVRVVRFKRNFGQHPAMHAGLANGRNRRGPGWLSVAASVGWSLSHAWICV